MQAKHRATLEFLVFAGLCAAIALVLNDNGDVTLLTTGWGAAAFIPLAGAVVFALFSLPLIRNKDVSLLTGALWDLIRMMEIRARNAAGGRAEGRRQLLHEFAVEGGQKVGAGRPMLMGDTAALDLTRLAFELMDRNEKDGTSYSNRINSLRRGLFVFYAMLRLKKPELAFRAMCEHMKIQLRMGEDSGIDNFTEMKRLLGLPAEWPVDARLIALHEEQGLPTGRRRAILAAVKNGWFQIFDGVQYLPAGAGGEPIIDPEKILDKMRDYIR